MEGRTDGRTYVCTDVHEVMAMKPNFLTSMGYHICLAMMLRARAPSARAELRYYELRDQCVVPLAYCDGTKHPTA